MGRCTSKPKSKSLKFYDPTTANDEIPSAKEIVNIPASTIKEFLRQTIKTHYIFQCLTSDGFDFMISKLKFIMVPEKKLITREGAPGNFCYIMNGGHAEITTAGTSKGILNRGDIFGESDIIQCVPRSSTITTTGQCTLWYLSSALTKLILKLILQDNKATIKELIWGMHIFSSLSAEVKKNICTHVVIENYTDSQLITKKGTKASSVFIVKSGHVTINIRGRNKGHLYPGQVFGEAVLLVDNYMRSANIIACGKVQVLSLYINHIKECVGSNYKGLFIENIIINVISIDPMAKYFEKNDIEKIAKHFEIKEVKKGDIAIPEGRDPKKYCYAICLGKIASDENSFVTYQFIGFDNANAKKLGGHMYIAGEETIIAEISAEKIQEILGKSIEEINAKLRDLNIIASTSLFHDASLNSLQLLHSGMIRKNFRAMESIFEENRQGNKLFIITKGSVGLYSNSSLIAILGKGSVLGETCLVNTQRLVAAKAHTTVECLGILKDTAMQLLVNNKFELRLQKQMIFESVFNINDLSVVTEQKMLNYRNFYIVHSAVKTKNYLVEVIAKGYVSDLTEFSRIMDQKACLLKINYPQIPRMIRNFMDPKFVYFVYDYLPCTYLSDCDYSKFTENCARFIILSLNNILNALSSLSILHRNICPDNIFIDETGYVHLHNFMCGKIVKDRTFTEIGKPIYRPKEMFTKTGYDSTAQYWSLGIILYELLTNTLPFELQETEISLEHIYLKIATKPLKIPSSVSPSAAEVIRGLLNLNPKERFGSEQLKTCEWVQTCNFHDIEMKKVKSPLKVTVNTYPIPESRLNVTDSYKRTSPEKSDRSDRSARDISIPKIDWQRLFESDNFSKF